MRDSGLLRAEIAWYLIYKFVDWAMFVMSETDPELKVLGERTDEIERAHGLTDDESFFAGEGPPEWEEAARAWTATCHQRFVEIFDRAGESEMAEQGDDAGEDPRFEAGRVAIFGEDEELGRDENVDDADQERGS